MNIFLIIILAIILIDYILDVLVGILNVRHAKLELPREFQGWYDAQKYKKSQEYLKTRTRFSVIKDSFFTALIIAFILGPEAELTLRHSLMLSQGSLEIFIRHPIALILLILTVITIFRMSLRRPT